MVLLIALSLDSLSLENKVFEIAKKLNCLVCPGESVAYSQSELAIDMRNKIRELLKEGKSEKEILDYFVSIYGENVLSEPPKEGIFNFLWIFPYVILVVSFLGIIIYFYTRKT
ncbi:MAG: cytochrome c-type biogenesis protein CcmH [candidate division WOR-3 bacterium]